MKTADLVNYLVEQIGLLEPDHRFMLGLVGYPGSGKSTTSEALASGVNSVLPDTARVVPMDGFHLSNEVLADLGLLELKGIPATFDAVGFVKLLRTLRKAPAQDTGCPLFDRSIEASIPDGIKVSGRHRLLVVEGNYLLLPEPPWDAVKSLLDEVWFLDAEIANITPRLIRRHIAGGRSEEGSRQKVESTDLPNARLIESTRDLADRII